MAMTATIFRFPYSASRRVHSRKPRRSKNGTPEERAAKAAAEAAKLVPAAIVDLSGMIAEASADRVDRRKLRGSPLRDQVATISFGATVVGRMHTAGLKGEPLAQIQPEIRKEWLEVLRSASTAAQTVANGLDQAAAALMQIQAKEPYVMTEEEFEEAYRQASPEIQEIISDKILSCLERRPSEPKA
jgi:hypothetical protein